ncbi:MAG: NAD(P)(+) transhydrogenase (Re/Si-specific) subunit alpha [Deltaproteobacteria bacterium]|nr:NAD(P)(+) transhydrogenase (Re/Si-specific) subunit alpha [Deltaproteobacteria bacterium]
MRVGIPTEVHPGERRVAATPDTVKKLIKLGFEVSVQAGAGEGARLSDEAFEQAGAEIVADVNTLWSTADIVLKVRGPETDPADGTSETERLRDGGWLISLIHPAINGPLVERLAERKATVIALDQIPRISRAQKMDVLSSMANIAGYRAVIEAANHFGSFFSGQITAAGRTRPAQVMVIGAGVAGLAAIAAARGLGAEVRAFDVRLAAKEQVESLGAKFLELEFPADESGETSGGYAKTMSKEFIDAEMELFRAQAKQVDIIVTTALIPGKTAPILITKDMVESMRSGSIVVDLAAEQGGNCEYTQPDRAIEVRGVTILGYTDLTSRLATQSSQLFGSNLVNLLSDMVKDGECVIDMEDEVVRKSLVLKDGVVTWPPPPDPAKAIAPPPTAEVPKPVEPEPTVAVSEDSKSSMWPSVLGVLVGAAAIWMGAQDGMDTFVSQLTVFVLACFVGWQVVWNVTAALHTPLMSVTNAISGIIIVGGLLQTGVSDPFASPAAILGAVAILVASINIAGGFLVTQRMLAMFRK